MTSFLGGELINLCREAREDVFIAAPFIKVNVLKMVLEVIQVSACNITVVTRWKAEEIAAGVSDLEVYDLVAASNNTRLLLHPCLHAKYYRIDGRCLIGSANLTAKALGWAPVSNIEILVEVDPLKYGLNLFEERLLSEAIVATETIKESIMQIAQEIRTQDVEGRRAMPLHNSTSGVTAWLPTCVNPEYLYRIYKKKDSELISSAVKTGYDDLLVLEVVEGLNEEEFKRYIAAALGQIDVVRQIAERSKGSPVTREIALEIISMARSFIASPGYDADTYWEILKAWLLYFFPKKYRVKASAEVFEQARELL